MLTELHAIITQLRENITKMRDLIEQRVSEQVNTRLQKTEQEMKRYFSDFIHEHLTTPDTLLTPQFVERLTQQLSHSPSPPTSSVISEEVLHTVLQDSLLLGNLTKHILDHLPVPTSSTTQSSPSPPSSSPDSLSAVCNVTLKDVQKLLDAHHRRLVADETLKVDWALEAAGAQVVESLTRYTPLTSSSYSNLSSSLSTKDTNATFLSTLSLWLKKMWHMFIHLPTRLTTRTHGPREALRAGRTIGQCWPFLGGQANLTIRTAEPIIPTHFSIDHIPREIAINWQSAPRQMKVWGFNVPEGSRPSLNVPRTLLSSFEYDINGDPLQTWPVEYSSQSASLTHPPSFQYFTLQILSNYGYFYTCLYRFRVHGHLARQYSTAPSSSQHPTSPP
jgi:hypothetical protein